MTQENVFFSENIETVFDATISDASKGFVFDILRNKIYSNKIGAVVRETIANAKDAHAAAKKPEAAIHIEIPTSEYPFFVVQDWGTGIPQEIIKEVYMDYGSSTKKSKDPNSLEVGKFGVGANSPHCYTDSFTITTVVDGTKYFYVNALNGKVNQLNLLSKEDTTEENGTTISIPVKSRDITQFEREIFNYTKYWKVQPSFNKTWNPVHNGNDSYPKYSDLLLKGTGWSIDNSAKNICLVGEIPTPINIYEAQVGILLSDYWIDNLVLEFAADEIDIPVSREFLEYTDKTKAAIKKRLETFKEEMPLLISEKVNEQKTLKEAISFFYFSIPNLLIYKCPGISYGSIPVRRSYDFSFQFLNYSRGSGKKSNVKKTDQVQIASQWGPSKNIIVINDTGKKSYFKKEQLCLQYGVSTIYYIPLGLKDTDFEEETDADEFINKHPLLKDLEVLKLSEIYTPPPRQKRSYEKKEKGKITAYVYARSSGYRNIYSLCNKTEVSIEPSSDSTYFEIVGLANSNHGAEDLFPFSFSKNVNNLDCLKEVLTGVQNLYPDLKIYGITSCNIPKLEEGWTHLSVYIQNWVLNELSKSAGKLKYFPAPGVTNVDYAEFLCKTKSEIVQFNNREEVNQCRFSLLSTALPTSIIKSNSLGSHALIDFLVHTIKLKEYRDNLAKDLNLCKYYKPLNFDKDTTAESVIMKEFLDLKNKYPLIDSLFTVCTAHEILDYVSLIDRYEVLKLASQLSQFNQTF